MMTCSTDLRSKATVRPVFIGLVGFCFITMFSVPALAQVGGIPAFNISEGDDGSTYSLSLQILALMTALTLLPSLVLGMTSFRVSSSFCLFYVRLWAPSRHRQTRCWWLSRYF